MSKSCTFLRPLTGALLAFFSIVLFAVLGCSSPTPNTPTSDTAPDTAIDDDGIDVPIPDGDCPKGPTGCGDSAPETTVDSGSPEADSVIPETMPETAADSGTETLIDSGIDTAVTETAIDTGVDSAPIDTGVDSTTVDSAPETIIDSGTPDTYVGDTGTDAPTDSGPPKSFSCTGWTRDSAFDTFKVGGLSVSAVGGIWGTSGSNVYITAASSTHGTVAHWNGTKWNEEVLPGDTTYPSDPTQVNGIWGTDDDHVWVAARGAAQAILYRRSSGTWSKDTTAPYAKDFGGVWGSSSSNLFLVGWKPGESIVWQNSGGGWVKGTLPSTTTTGYRAFGGRIWGLDANHVYIPGYYDSGTAPTKGFIMFFNGTSWTEISAPVGCVEARGISGTSPDDLFVTCLKSDYTGLVYRVTSGLTVWTDQPSTGAPKPGPVLSRSPGTAVVNGYNSTGYSVIATYDQVSGPVATTLTSAFQGSALWGEPGTNVVHFVHNASGGIVGGHYTGICN